MGAEPVLIGTFVLTLQPAPVAASCAVAGVGPLPELHHDGLSDEHQHSDELRR